jgi:flagellar hook assembly protein FlgD
MAVTAAYIAGVETEKATGSVIEEIFMPSGINDMNNKSFRLINVAPNPFSVSTEFRYVMTEDAAVTLYIRDISGRMIKTFVPQKETVGENSVVWDGTNDQGQKASPGIYFYTLVSGQNTVSGKLIYLAQ